MDGDRSSKLLATYPSPLNITPGCHKAYRAGTYKDEASSLAALVSDVTPQPPLFSPQAEKRLSTMALCEDRQPVTCQQADKDLNALTLC